ncbi:hypothetical protein [Streptomyces hesseae]|uniref:Uncharacterized protein n=1 Tax=Streptomyces hesseae TaxID=3075519 RepID=A0ABU2SLV6_9ACTN|nr:hypothetical protein [Streptomyces sp. DSM 40473]MDT0449966.1 hypothetical protein [Streptomyces sp. DSM 40473]
METVPRRDTPTDNEQTSSLFAQLIALLEDAADLGADVIVKLHQPVPAALMDCVREAIEAPGFRITGSLAEAIGASGTATVSVIAEVIQ